MNGHGIVIQAPTQLSVVMLGATAKAEAGFTVKLSELIRSSSIVTRKFPVNSNSSEQHTRANLEFSSNFGIIIGQFSFSII